MRFKEKQVVNSDAIKSGCLDELQNKKINEIFQFNTATILWCACNQDNKTSDDENAEILRCARRIVASTSLKSYRQFLSIIKRLTCKFGQVVVFDSDLARQYEIDHEFWSDVFKVIKGKKRLRISIN